MSLAHHDYQCPRCGHIARDHMVEISVGAMAGAPECPNCLTADGHVIMEWLPATTAMDCGGVKGAAFRAFETFDGQNRKVQVNNLRDLRRLESESEKMSKDGIGQPLRFRRWSQTDSNKDVNTFTDQFKGGEQPTAAAKKKFGSTLRKSAEAPDSGYGPGVNDSNTSALPE